MLIELSWDISSFMSSGSILLRGPSCLLLVLPLLSASTHAISTALLPLPLLPIAERSMGQQPPQAKPCASCLALGERVMKASPELSMSWWEEV